MEGSGFLRALRGSADYGSSSARGKKWLAMAEEEEEEAKAEEADEAEAEAEEAEDGVCSF